MATDNKQSGVSPREALFASVGLAALLVISAVILIALDKDIAGLVGIANLIALPLLGGLGTMLYTKFNNVESQVNGRMTELIDHAKNSQPLKTEE